MLPDLKAKLLQEVAKERDKYITKSEPSTKKGDELVQATAATVGFFSEIAYHRKEKKTIKESVQIQDALVTSTVEPPVSCETVENAHTPIPKDLAAAFLARSPPFFSNADQTSPVLSTPVLVPQRRPNTRARGFVPTYAPVLSAFDISQATFLDFIITLNASLEPNPYLNAINLAGFAGEASPDPVVGLLVGFGVETITDMIMETQSRVKSNGFLDKVNAEFFEPRGLFVFVGMWHPQEKQNGHTTGPHANEVHSASQPQLDVFEAPKSSSGGKKNVEDAWRDVQEQVQRAMVPAGGQIATVTSAPLVWASADEIAAAMPDNMSKKKNRFDRAGVWLDDHVDKHSQVKWTQEYPDHPLAGSLPKPKFRSRYADPSHAASSGDIVALLTGGQWHVKEDEKKKEKEIRKRLEEEQRKEKKQKEKELKGKLKAEKSKAKAESADNRISKENTSRDGASAADANDESEKIEAGRPHDDNSRGSQDSSKQRQQMKEPKRGLSSLLEDNLLYLIIVQHPSFAGST